MQITPSNLDAIFYSFSTLYQSGFDGVKPWSTALTTTVPSAGRENRYAWMANLPRMREWLGERVVQNVSSRGHIIVNKPFELTIELTQDEIEDDQLGVYNPVVQQMGMSAAKLQDDQIGALLKAGLSTLCYDGQFFFDTDHPYNMDNAALGTYANRFTAKPLTMANFDNVRTTMRTYKGDNGKPLGMNPRLLVVPPQLETTALQIANAEQIAPATAFGINASGGFQTNVIKGSVDVLVVEDLADEPGAWYLADVSKPIKPLVWQNRKAPQFVQFTDPSSESVFWRRRFVYGVSARGAGGYALPFLMARCEA